MRITLNKPQLQVELWFLISLDIATNSLRIYFGKTI